MQDIPGCFNKRNKMKFKDELAESYSPSRGYEGVTNNINQLTRALNPKSNLAKGIAKELGDGFINDFKELHKLAQDLEAAWAEIEFAVDHQ